jgi:osmotically-inducible protein OsmY
MHATHTLTAALLAAALSLPVAADITSSQEEVRDAWLDGKLEATFMFNQNLSPFDIDTRVKGGVAYLTGAVESDIDKELASEIAKSTKGIKNVENNLVVDKDKALVESDTKEAQERKGFKQQVLNATLTARVKSQLLLHEHTDGFSINVDSYDGVVTLFGVVDSAEERDLALQLAQNTDGAESVVDNLKIGDM